LPLTLAGILSALGFTPENVANKTTDGTLAANGAQQPAIPDAAGGVVVDAEACTALNTLLAELRLHGLIAT
jgi:hypothetical protein